MRLLNRMRWIAALIVSVFTATLIGAPWAAAQQSPIGRVVQGVQGMSTRKKVLLLAGAAALYWLYKRHQNSQGVGPQGRYYRSRNGRVYYRDPRTHRAIWVTPPPASRPIEVPADEYQRYAGRLPAGYDGGAGRVLTAPPGPMAQ
jgi:hypothetical protein